MAICSKLFYSILQQFADASARSSVYFAGNRETTTNPNRPDALLHNCINLGNTIVFVVR